MNGLNYLFMLTVSVKCHAYYLSTSCHAIKEIYLFLKKKYLVMIQQDVHPP